MYEPHSEAANQYEAGAFDKIISDRRRLSLSNNSCYFFWLDHG